MMFATFDPDGRPTAFYNPVQNFPDDAVEIDDATYAELLSDQKTKRFRGGQVVDIPAPPSMTPAERAAALADRMLLDKEKTALLELVGELTGTSSSEMDQLLRGKLEEVISR